MVTKTEILDSALDVLRANDPLTLDSVARAIGLTKPGVVHHFPTKEVLSLAVLDHLLDAWERELAERAGSESDAADRLRAYVEHTLLSDMDLADLALLADPKLRDALSARWTQGMDIWFGQSTEPHIVAARLVADGAWIDRGLGILSLDHQQRRAVADVALALIAQEDHA